MACLPSLSAMVLLYRWTEKENETEPILNQSLGLDLLSHYDMSDQVNVHRYSSLTVC